MSVTVELDDIKNNPQCPHGPTLLFARTVNGEKRKFYACSACRDRKDCGFFLWESDLKKTSDARKKARDEVNRKYTSGINHIKLFAALNDLRNLPPSQRLYCKSCSGFQLPKYRDKHVEHETVGNVSDYDLSHASEFLEPMDNARKEAQFLFSQSTVKVIVDILCERKIRNVLCVGAPRIHEYISNEKPDMTSLLLDIDKRYLNFYGPLEFCWYNSFNHHFFLPDAVDVFKNFLQTDRGKDLAVITDPPFGGRVEPLAHTLKTIDRWHKYLNNTTSDLPVFWCFPYFMEPQILNSLPGFAMLDYKVGYDNHPLFHNESERPKRGSPVRIFTNINPRTITLPLDEGYKHCKKCNRWVSAENKHCDICNACTSKDGRTYVHCGTCERCVKPSWKHCETCSRCAVVDHKCGDIVVTQECFHCKEKGHKKRDCPKVDHEELKRKRKDSVIIRKKRKKSHM